MAQDPAELKSMPLYRDVDRIDNELREAGITPDTALSVGDLTPFDQYHYHGTEAVDVAIATLDIGKDDRVLEIGSGIGGPARYLAAHTGARVVALELQPDLSAMAQALTRRCGLADRVEHVCVDVLDFAHDTGFDAIVSWLALFHIEQRTRLLDLCRRWLTPGGGMFVEDLYARGELSAAERNDLEVTVFSRFLPDRERYEAGFREAGFDAVTGTDMSDDWRAFTGERYAAFRAERERHLRVHGDAIVAGLNEFYATVARLFAGGNLGGLRLSARKPA